MTMAMDLPVLASDAQQQLFRRWSQDSVFVLDIYDSPERQFCVLAKLLDWVGGEEPWNTHWEECFGKVYVWRAPEAIIAAPTPEFDYAADDVAAASSSASKSINSDNIWGQFDGFKPNPRATFNREFQRLARHMHWAPEERRRYRVELFEADFAAHIGSDVCDIKQWQDLCSLCSIYPVPDNIPECMEVLENVYVNIHDVLNSQRTSESVVPFDDFSAFRKYTLNGRMYPVEKAKKDTFLPIFLKVLHPHITRRD